MPGGVDPGEPDALRAQAIAAPWRDRAVPGRNGFLDVLPPRPVGHGRPKRMPGVAMWAHIAHGWHESGEGPRTCPNHITTGPSRVYGDRCHTTTISCGFRQGWSPCRHEVYREPVPHAVTRSSREPSYVFPEPPACRSVGGARLQPPARSAARTRADGVGPGRQRESRRRATAATLRSPWLTGTGLRNVVDVTSAGASGPGRRTEEEVQGDC